MKKRIVLFLCALMSTSVFAASFKKGQTLYVTAKTVTIKDGSGNFAKNVGKLTYGDKVKVLSVSGKKVQVQLFDNSSVSGWMSQNDLTKKKISKTSSGGKVNASAEEIALAGKGLLNESEDTYKASHSNLDFNLVDSIESIVIPEDDVKSFLNEGHLKGASE